MLRIQYARQHRAKVVNDNHFPNEPMQRAAIYCRVSTDKQEEQKTIDSQVAELRDTCKRDGVEVVREYLDDGVSGATLARPALDRLRDDAAHGAFEFVYILSVDRLARKYLYQALVLEELKKRHVQVVILNRPVTDRPEDQLLLGVQGLIAEFERAQIVERTRRGRLHKARQGEIVSATSPYGYRYVPRTKTSPATYQVDEHSARVVRLIFALYLRSASSVKVSLELLRRGIPAPQGGRLWHPCVINKLLRLETYAGRAHYNKTQGTGALRPRSDWIAIPVPNIVGDQTFRAAQTLLDRRKGGRRLRTYLLSGLVRCHHCSAPYVGCPGNHGTTPYYRCTNLRQRFPLPRTCFAKLVRAERLESAVLQTLKRLLLDPEVLIGHIERHLAKARQSPARHAKADDLRRSITQLSQRQARLLEIYLDGAIGKAEYKVRSTELGRLVAETSEQLANAEREHPVIHLDDVRREIGAFARQSAERLERLPLSELAAWLRFIVERVVYDWEARSARMTITVPTGQAPQDALPDALSPLPGGLKEANRDNTVKVELDVKVG